MDLHDQSEVRFDDGDRDLRFKGGNVFWDQNGKEHCRLASHFDPSGAEEIALVCPTCGHHRRHQCHAAGPALLPFGAAARVDVTYARHPGLDAGTYPAFVVRASGRVARVHFTYEDGETEVTHLYQSAEGACLDLNYGVPCEVRSDH